MIPTTSEKAISDYTGSLHDITDCLDERETSPAQKDQPKLKWSIILLAFLSCIWASRLDYPDLIADSIWIPSGCKSFIRSDLKRQQESPTATANVLECFQVAQPVTTLDNEYFYPTASNESEPAADGSPHKACSALLMEHVFAFSYGMPFVGNYTPPNCTFNRVIMNFTVVSSGRQFDRLALMYFGDTEVWRTSTAEPTQPPGIRWTFMKDMTEYLYFWKSPQKLIFDLGNLVNDKYTGSFNATLTATFFQADVNPDAAPPADLIIPISARKGAANGASHFTLPADNATSTIAFPQHANRAVFSISANGQAAEEFWWANVLQSDVLTFNKTAGKLLGSSPFREVQLLIDGNLAGVQWPFPVIFTGGVVPSLHRPIVGLQAFDLREHEIDITPWLPVLCDGAEHTFAIKVLGLDDSKGNRSVVMKENFNDSWYVTGKVFLWLDEEGSVTTGVNPVVEISEPNIVTSRFVTQNSTGFNETLSYNTTVERIVSIKSTLSSKAQTGESSWSQSLSYSNQGFISSFGVTQSNNFTITGVDSSDSPAATYKAAYAYPLACEQTYTVSPNGDMSLRAHLIQGMEVQVEGDSVFPTGLEAFEGASSTGEKGEPYAASHLKTYRDGTAFFSQTGNGRHSSGHGTTNQVFYFSGSREKSTLSGDGGSTDELYFRNVTAVNGTIVSDAERKVGVETLRFSRTGGLGEATEEALALFAQVPEKAAMSKGAPDGVGGGGVGDDIRWAHRGPAAQERLGS